MAAVQGSEQKTVSRVQADQEKMMELLTTKNNVERIWGVTEKEENRDRQQGTR